MGVDLGRAGARRAWRLAAVAHAPAEETQERRGGALLPRPYEIALERLDKLLRSDMLDKGQVREFYFELTALLRTYIEGQFSLRAPEQTTEEFLAELRKSLAFNPQTARDLLRRFLEHGDMVKFAKLEPSRDEAIRGC